MSELLPEHVGIDFGNHSIKLVELKNAYKRNPSVRILAAAQTPAGVINSYEDDKKKQVVEALKLLIDQAKPSSKYAVAALPESSVFSRVIDLPKMDEEEVQDAVYWEAKQYMPLPIDELRVGTIEVSLNQQTGERKVLVVAAPNKLADLYAEIIEKAGLIPVGLESETLASLRTIQQAYEVGDGIMLDFGSGNTDMAIMKGGYLYFSQSIATGGEMLTKALMTDFQVNYGQAEEYKRTYGLLSDQAEGKIYNSLKVVVDSIVTDVVRGIEFFKSQTQEVPPNSIYLAGDGALLPGLAQYVSNHVGLQTQVIDPWQRIKVPGNLKEVAESGRPAYSIAVGLCLKPN